MSSRGGGGASWLGIAILIGALALVGGKLGWWDLGKASLDKLGLGKPGAGSSADANDLAPDFTLKDLRGKAVSLQDQRGKVVLVNFWATWCGPCMEEMPSLESLGRTLRGQPFVILGVSSDSTSPPVQRAVGQLRLTFPILLDPEKAVAKLYATSGYPESYLVGGDGRLIRKYVGAQRWDSPEIMNEVVRAVSKVGGAEKGTPPGDRPKAGKG